MEKEFLYHGKFNVNLKHLPPIDPSIITTQAKKEKPSNKNVSRVAKPSPEEEETSLVEIGGAHTKESLKVKEEDDDSFCSSKYIDPISTKTISKEKEKEKAKQGAPNRTSAKSQLHEICATNKWNPPLFECCKEEGPCHLKLFTFKVIVEIEVASNTVLECFGAPRSKKKTAADHAAEGALWYLKHLGHLPINK